MAEALPRVGVLLATYNGAAHLETQLRSIFWQTGVAVSVLARDDGSTDGTRNQLSRCCELWPGRMQLLMDTEPTGSAAGNFFALLRAIDLATVDFVALSDQDDVWFPDKLLRAVTMMQAQGADGYSSDLLAYDEAAAAGWLMQKSGRDAALDYLFQGASAGCTYVLSRTAVEQVRAVLVPAVTAAFPPASHDWAIYAACRSRGLGWVRDRVATLIYRQHGGNVYGARPGMRGLAQRVRLTRSRWYRKHILWLQEVVQGTPAELAVLGALRRDRWRDRWMLSRQADHFRRSQREVRLLRVALLTGLL